jgi:hypothetical protein
MYVWVVTGPSRFFPEKRDVYGVVADQEGWQTLARRAVDLYIREQPERTKDWRPDPTVWRQTDDLYYLCIQPLGVENAVFIYRKEVDGAD